MRGGHHVVCGCFPTGRHYPGIAERIARIVERIEGLWEEHDAAAAWLEARFAVIDFETTGLDPANDRILEIGIVCFEGGELRDRHNFLVNPGIPVPEEARAVHGITDEELASAPRFDELAPRVCDLLDGHLPVAYNADFDRAFLRAEVGRVRHLLPETLPPAMRDDVLWIDPLVWVREIHKYEKSKKLADACERLGIPLERAHRAAGDAEAAGRVLLALAADMPRSYGELIRIQTRYAAHQDVEAPQWRRR